MKNGIQGCHFGASWPRQVIMLLLTGGLVLLLVRMIGDTQAWIFHRAQVLVALGGIACWRWSWFLAQNVRAVVYRYVTFPRLRGKASRAVEHNGPVKELTILATTYHEKPWITQSVFSSIFNELKTVRDLEHPPKLVVVSGCDEDDGNIREVFAQCYEQALTNESFNHAPQLVLLRGDRGKRHALGLGLEEIARSNPDPDGVVIILDGDTMLSPGLLEKVLPIFRLKPEVAGATTNEAGLVKGPSWFAEWTSLRFGLRHRSMCSVSLSGRLLCLTGRFSAFRTAVAVDPTFRAQVECDRINHWWWGSFDMLSGDDKSTWYWLAAHQKRMLYVPDAKVVTIEVVEGSAVKRALANIRRWSGNSVRHGWRAIKLGPRKLGFFAWWCLVDQRLTTVTVLFGPTVAFLAACAGRFDVVAGYLLWVLCSRSIHAAMACRQARRFSAYYVPLTVLSDWAAALTKLWVMFHPAKQSWLNRGGRTLNTARGSAFYGLRNSFATYLYGFSCAALVVVVGVFIGLLPFRRESHLFLTPEPLPASSGASAEEETPRFHPRVLNQILPSDKPPLRATLPESIWRSRAEYAAVENQNSLPSLSK